MRQKIRDLVKGKFEYDRPKLILVEEELSFPVIEDEVYYGSFHIQSSDSRPIRGIVTCEHPSINIPNPEFGGTNAEIRFEFAGTTVAENVTDSGVFVVTSSAGEYVFPFSAQSTRHYLSTSIGKIKTINDFVNLSSLNWDEAINVFSSPFFCNIFHDNAEYYILLYNGLTRQKKSSHEMEEFLVATGKKKRVGFFVDDVDRKYSLKDPTVRVRDSVRIARTDWGYTNIRLTADEPFVELKKDRIGMKDFVGKHTEFRFNLLPELMHPGKNYAVITLDNGFTTERVMLTCTLGEEFTGHSSEWKRLSYRARLESSFIAFRMGTKPKNEWILESIDIINHAMEDDPKNRWMNLFLAYIYYKADDVDRVNEQLVQIPRNMRYARTPLAAMYQYVVFLVDGHEDDRVDLLAVMDDILRKYRRHPILNWIYLELDESMGRNPRRKYDAIREFMQGGNNSPVFYLEAALILAEHPELLDTRNEFDNRLLGWMSKKNLLTKELAWHIQNMVQGKQGFSRNYLRILGKCYKKFGDESCIKAICVYLIHTNHYGETYFPWFKRGVEHHLKIAGLYEAYILSWSRSQGELPPEIIRYFSMNSTLPSRRKAMLFAYIVRNKDRLKDEWEAYMSMVKDFAMHELSKGHMNDDLAIIYEEIRRAMPAKEWDKVKNESENCYKVHVGGTDFQAVHVLQNAPRAIARRTPIVGENAYVYLYHKPYVILFEGRDGQLYVNGYDSHVSRMLPGKRLSESPEHTNDEKMKDRQPHRDSIDDLMRLENNAGPIDEMCDLLLKVKATGAPVEKYAQQLMIRMLFTGHLGEHHDEVFSILRSDRDSEELLCAYASILARDLMLNDVPISESVYLFLWERLSRKRDENPYYKAAFLREYVSGGDEFSELAEQMFKSYLFGGLYFPFYANLPCAIKRKYLMMGINVVSYTAEPGEVFYVKLQDGIRETLEEVLPGLYTYPFRLLPGEIFEYSILDRDGRICTKGEIEEPGTDETFKDTRYGRLGELCDNRLDGSLKYAYAETCDLVDTLFVPVEE